MSSKINKTLQDKINDLGFMPTLLTQSSENRLFAYHLGFNHQLTNMFSPSLCIPKVFKSATNFFKIGQQRKI